MSKHRAKEGGKPRRSSFFLRPFSLFRLHPLFLAMGVWYAFTGELFLFLLTTLVAIQHECAHAFAAAHLGYKLNAIILMPYGAVLDGDLKGISFKDEIFVAVCGPLCNLATAFFFVAIWWFEPTMYAFTDVVFYSSLSIALVNLLPCYPLDGGRIVKCSLARLFQKSQLEEGIAEKKAGNICLALTLLFSVATLFAFILQCTQGAPNFSLLAFGLFLLVGGLGNRDKTAVYEKNVLTFTPSLRKGVEIRRVAIDGNCPVKDAFRFLSRGSYLVLEVYDEGTLAFELPQSQLVELFTQATTPYDTLLSLHQKGKNEQKTSFFA